MAPADAAHPPDAVAAVLAAMGALDVHDVSPVIDAGLPVWHTHPAPVVTPLATHERDGVAVNRLELSEHTGAHVDAPFHFDPHGATMAAVAVDALLLKPYVKYDLTAAAHAAGDLVGADELRAAERAGGFVAPAGGVAIIEMGWDRQLPGGAAGRPPGWWGRNQPGLDEDACEHLAGAGVAAVACDTGACDVAAVDGRSVSAYGHRHAFLPRGILIIEGLTGLAAAPATGLLIALPLAIAGGTGSPVRVVLLGR